MCCPNEWAFPTCCDECMPTFCISNSNTRMCAHLYCLVCENMNATKCRIVHESTNAMNVSFYGKLCSSFRHYDHDEGMCTKSTHTFDIYNPGLCTALDDITRVGGVMYTSMSCHIYYFHTHCNKLLTK